MPGGVLADLLAVAASAAADPAGPASGTSAARPGDPAQDSAILERIAGVLGAPGGPGDPGGLGDPAERGGPGGLSIARLAAGLRVLAQVGDPRDEARRGLLSEAEAEAVTGLYGRAAADRVIIERALMLEARLRPLADLGRDPGPLPPSRLRVVAMDRASRMASGQVIGGYVTAALTHLLRGTAARRGDGGTPCCCAGRNGCAAMCSTGCPTPASSPAPGWCSTYRSLSPQIRERLGRGNAAVAFMRLGNAEDARAASEQIGTEHRFVVAQLTDTVGTSVTDTAGDAYTSTVGSASSVALSSVDQPGQRAERGPGAELGRACPRSRRGRPPRTRRPATRAGVSDSASITDGITTGTAWGRQTARAAAHHRVGRAHRPAIPGVPRRAARTAATPAQRDDRQLCRRRPAAGWCWPTPTRASSACPRRRCGPGMRQGWRLRRPRPRPRVAGPRQRAALPGISGAAGPGGRLPVPPRGQVRCRR